MEGERFKTIFREGKEKKHLLDETLQYRLLDKN